MICWHFSGRGKLLRSQAKRKKFGNGWKRYRAALENFLAADVDSFPWVSPRTWTSTWLRQIFLLAKLAASRHRKRWRALCQWRLSNRSQVRRSATPIICWSLVPQFAVTICRRQRGKSRDCWTILAVLLECAKPREPWANLARRQTSPKML